MNFISKYIGPRFALRFIVVVATVMAGAVDAQSPAQERVLSLSEAVQLAAQQGSAVLMARAHTDEMDARTRESHSALLPHVGAAWNDGERSFNTASFGIPFPGFDPNGSVIGPVRTIDIRAHAQANIYDPSALSLYRNDQAVAVRADADGAASIQSAMASAASSYVRLARAEALVGARSADSALANELLGIAQAELGAGVGVALDVSRAQTQLATLRAQLIVARNERDRARLELVRATGLPLTTAIRLRDTLGAPAGPDPVESPDDAVAVALRARSDVRAAAAAVTAAQTAVRAVRAERLPTVGVFGDEGATSAKYGFLRNTYNYGIQVAVPIFSGFRDKARTEERDAVLRGAEQRRRDLETQIGLGVRLALLDLASAREQSIATREGLGFAEQALAQARDRFRTGVAGSSDVVSAQLDLSAARRQYIDALAAYSAARVSLALLEGRTATLTQ